MNILDKFFKGRQHYSDSCLRVTLKTDKNLSDGQKQKIISIVKNNFDDAEPAEIAIEIMRLTGIYEPVILIRDGDNIEVHF